MQSFLTEQEVSKRLNVSVATLRRWRLEKRGPMFVKVGSLVRYRPEDLDSWVAALPTGGAVCGHDQWCGKLIVKPERNPAEKGAA
ncbi:MAG: helix-turn-helix domain-containing protein [Acidobacteria bacterium]|nr:helix-turn-helix domain-containing protein [Acidobacteriota bacterium]